MNNVGIHFTATKNTHSHQTYEMLCETNLSDL